MAGSNGTHANQALDHLVLPFDLRLPAECPWRAAEGDVEESRCCRGKRLWKRAQEEPLCSAGASEDESYRFFWDESFGAGAFVRIGWKADKIVLRSQYWESIFGRSPGERARQKTLSEPQRKLFLDALAAAQFWTRDTVGRMQGFDGADWTIEGRRGDRYRRWELWSPREAFGQLGRTFFVLAGLPPSRL